MVYLLLLLFLLLLLLMNIAQSPDDYSLPSSLHKSFQTTEQTNTRTVSGMRNNERNVRIIGCILSIQLSVTSAGLPTYSLKSYPIIFNSKIRWIIDLNCKAILCENSSSHHRASPHFATARPDKGFTSLHALVEREWQPSATLYSSDPNALSYLHAS